MTDWVQDQRLLVLVFSQKKKYNNLLWTMMGSVTTSIMGREVFVSHLWNVYNYSRMVCSVYLVKGKTRFSVIRCCVPSFKLSKRDLIKFIGISFKLLFRSTIILEFVLFTVTEVKNTYYSSYLIFIWPLKSFGESKLTTLIWFVYVILV